MCVWTYTCVYVSMHACMYLCMCVCIYIYICGYVSMHACIHVSVRASMHACIYMYKCMYVCTNLCICVYGCTYLCWCTCIFPWAYVSMQVCTCLVRDAMLTQHAFSICHFLALYARVQIMYIYHVKGSFFGYVRIYTTWTCAQTAEPMTDLERKLYSNAYFHATNQG